MKKLSSIQLLALSGIFGSLLMFTGDMLLYFEPVSGKDYDSIARMADVSIGRLIAGGIVAPFAAIFSIIGFYMFYQLFRTVNKRLAISLFVISVIFFILAATYHALFPNFGFVGRLPDSLQGSQVDMIRSYLKSIYNINLALGACWTILLIYLVIFNKTQFPYWMLPFTPFILILLSGVIKEFIPYPLGAIIYGGWINLCFVFFFILCFVQFKKLNTIVKL